MPLPFIGSFFDNVAINTAAGSFGGAGDNERRGLINVVLHPLPTLLPLESFLRSARGILTNLHDSIGHPPVKTLLGELTNASLNFIGRVLALADPKTVFDTTTTIAMVVLNAVFVSAGHIPIIRDGILGNEVNVPTLQLIWGQRTELAIFLVDIFECTKCFVLASGFQPTPDQSRVRYNELNLTQPMNRHAIICQVQRLAKSVIAILQTPVRATSLSDINMSAHTMLDTDFTIIPSVRTHQVEVTPEKNPSPTDERWVFVNGIGGEYHWLRLACQKLAERFNRHIVGVFNRGDGLLWDLVECAGERRSREEGSTDSQDALIQATASSKDARKALREQLESMLGHEVSKCVVVAHSQGCLLLRLALEDLIFHDNNEYRNKMKQQLYVFTFGNPSIHWRLNRRPREQPNEEDWMLQSYSVTTEHFANRGDFVAKLGVLRERSRAGGNEDDPGEKDGYPSEKVYINENWRGHLFGAQYSLDGEDYMRGRASVLLNW